MEVELLSPVTASLTLLMRLDMLQCLVRRSGVVRSKRKQRLFEVVLVWIFDC